MNERLKELAEQAGLNAKEIRENGSQTLYAFENFDLERFAELVRQDERDKCAQDYLQDCCDAVDSAYKAGKFFEREACALLCEELSKANWTFCNFAAAIKARGNHEQN
jgi:hypothetical protein